MPVFSQVRSLCLQLLDQERTDFYGSPTERYPDEASVRAMEILKRIVSRGDLEVVRVMKFWLAKIDSWEALGSSQVLPFWDANTCHKCFLGLG